jgi:MSHA biogenesis protein MshK
VFNRFLKIFLVPVLLSILPAQSWSLSDPTRPSAYQNTAVGKNNLRLESILFSASRRVAVINGKIVAEGDTIGRSKIIKISNDSVKINRDGQFKTLKLKRTPIRQEK